MRRPCAKGVRVGPRRTIDCNSHGGLSRADVMALVNAIVSQAIREVEETARSAKQSAEAA